VIVEMGVGARYGGVLIGVERAGKEAGGEKGCWNGEHKLEGRDVGAI
jgi:hypothetical protein